MTDIKDWQFLVKADDRHGWRALAGFPCVQECPGGYSVHCYGRTPVLALVQCEAEVRSSIDRLNRLGSQT